MIIKGNKIFNTKNTKQDFKNMKTHKEKIKWDT